MIHRPRAAVGVRLLTPILGALLVGCGPTTGIASPSPMATTSAAAELSASPAVSATIAPGWDAVIVGEQPLVDFSAIEDVRHLLAGTAFRDEATAHAWVVGFREAVGDQSPYHVTWDLGAGSVTAIDPVDIDPGIELADPGPIPQSVIRETDGTYSMYGWGTIAAEELRPVIWRASAQTLAGPWTAAPGVVFLPATGSAWDSARIDFPTVLSGESGGRVMVYEGASVADPDTGHIGFARSRNGVTWSHGEVPVLSPGQCGHGDEATVYGPRALALETGLLVAYLGNDGNTTRGIYLAEAQADGSWDCQTPAPVLVTAAFGSNGGFHSFAAFEDGGVPHVLVEVLSADFDTSGLWLVRLEAPR